MDCKPLYITSLNSGSNGNCYYVGNADEAILVDAGISCKETEKRMLRLGLSMSKVKAIFISHEHGDHIRGLAVLSKKYDLPVYITNGTRGNCKINLCEHLVRSFNSHDTIHIGSLSVTCFPKVHNAIEPHSFMVSCGTIKVGVFTDLGQVCNQLRTYFKQCDAAFLEANYDEELLQNGKYPYYLKRRISGGQGHLSNTQALDLLRTHRPPKLSHLLLAHLSKDNNDPELVEYMFNQHAGDTTVVVATRYMETPVFTIGASGLSERAFQTGQLNLQLQDF